MNIRRFINTHTVLLLVFIITIAGLTYRFFHWGQRVDPSQFGGGNGEDTTDTLDLILPLLDQDGNIVNTGEPADTIVFFGNAPFADDRDSEDNLVNLIAAKTNATVYNCSIGGSYLAAQSDTLRISHFPRDAYNFYWLVHLAAKSPVYDRLIQSDEILGEEAAPEASGVFDTLWNLDFKDVDTIAIMYDASDYLAGHEMYNDLNATDIQQFTGNLEAGIELIQDTYPWIRIIVMSPTYAYAVDEDGNYVSSDQYTYGWDVLSTYSIKEHSSCFNRSVTFVDNLYGTVNEDNASDYLTDNLHLNRAGRELVADRFIDALYYYDQKEDSPASSESQ